MVNESEHYQFILEVLRLFSPDETDCNSFLFWRCHEPGAVEFFLEINDVFYWATADLEPIIPEDLPAMRQAIVDVRQAIGGNHDYEALLLWAARKRKMRPLLSEYPKEQQLREMFDSCGPDRDVADNEHRVVIPFDDDIETSTDENDD